ncbi:hypothetical protein BJY00DRAFT_286141 [Aspergillus carlsbadensis]|nr:hypothetical protein BJY00DRAFT_286141 [Aspergillus carlsbadensis]
MDRCYAVPWGRGPTAIRALQFPSQEPRSSEPLPSFAAFESSIPFPQRPYPEGE